MQSNPNDTDRLHPMATYRTTRRRGPRVAILLAVLALVGAAAGYYAVQATADAPAPAAAMPAMPVTVASVIERNVTEWHEFSGRLEAVERVEVRSRVSGFIDSVQFAPGAIVKKGATLFMIDPRPFAAEVARAEAAVTAAQARLALTVSEAARAQRLFDDRAIAQREFDERQNARRDAQASLQGAQAALEIARLELGYTRITAPITGRVGRAEVTAGNLVAAGAAGAMLTSIVSTSPIYATFEADEQTFLRYAAGAGIAPGTPGITSAPIRLGLANETGHPREGRIESVDNRLDPRSGTIRVRAVFDNTDGRLAPGLYARLRLGDRDERPAALIDDRAVGTDQSKKFVLVVDADRRVHYREVTLGPTIDGLRVVRDGVRPGETIVVNGVQRARPGTQVAPTEVKMGARTPATPPVRANTAVAGDS